MAVELVGIETCYRHQHEIPPRFKPCPYGCRHCRGGCRSGCRRDNNPPFAMPATAAATSASALHPANRQGGWEGKLGVPLPKFNGTAALTTAVPFQPFTRMLRCECESIQFSFSSFFFFFLFQPDVFPSGESDREMIDTASGTRESCRQF